jgi:hypothetical protein
MKLDITEILYNKIMCAEDESDISALNLEIQTSILTGKITESRDMMILNMAIQLKSDHFTMKELLMFGADISASVIMEDCFEDFDPEAMQLEEMHNEEFEDFKNGNVISMKDFTKKD